MRTGITEYLTRRLARSQWITDLRQRRALQENSRNDMVFCQVKLNEKNKE